MKIQLIAHTEVHLPVLETLGYVDSFEADSGDALAEFAGRNCYQAWDKLNPETATNEGYLANIIDHQHFSVLEHASATFFMEGVSRALLAELTRHRHLSFSVLSQRYVNEHYRTQPVMPPAANDHPAVAAIVRKQWELANDAYGQIVNLLQQSGLPRKKAREAARAVLPNSTETKIVVTGNYRAWREVINKRDNDHADAEIHEMAAEVLRILKIYAPNSFQDMT